MFYFTSPSLHMVGGGHLGWLVSEVSVQMQQARGKGKRVTFLAQKYVFLPRHFCLGYDNLHSKRRNI